MAFNLDFKVNLWTILLIVALIFVILPRTLCNTPRIESRFDWTHIHAWLKNAMYTQAERADKPKPENLPPEIKETVTSSTSASGVWTPDTVYAPGDTLIVTASDVTLSDDSHWLRIMIDDKPVVIQQLDYYHREIQRRWIAFFEVTNCEVSRIGVGIGYRLFDVAGVDIVPAVSASVHGDWIAPELRFQRAIWSGIAVGIGGGYRFGVGSGLHLSAGISLEL